MSEIQQIFTDVEMQKNMDVVSGVEKKFVNCKNSDKIIIFVVSTIFVHKPKQKIRKQLLCL